MVKVACLFGPPTSGLIADTLTPQYNSFFFPPNGNPQFFALSNSMIRHFYKFKNVLIKLPLNKWLPQIFLPQVIQKAFFFNSYRTETWGHLIVLSAEQCWIAICKKLRIMLHPTCNAIKKNGFNLNHIWEGEKILETCEMQCNNDLNE